MSKTFTCQICGEPLSYLPGTDVPFCTHCGVTEKESDEALKKYGHIRERIERKI